MELLTGSPAASATESQTGETRAAAEAPKSVEAPSATRTAERQLWGAPATLENPKTIESPAVSSPAEPQLWAIPAATEEPKKIQAPPEASAAQPQPEESAKPKDEPQKIETSPVTSTTEAQNAENSAASQEPKEVQEPKQVEVPSAANTTMPQLEEILSEPDDVEAAPAIPIPLIKPNMIAREVAVQAMGVPPEKNELERALFDEATASLLVCETGGVIRLSAAVTPGQLLVLRNVEAKREVVVQVLRKRAYKPTICYVELDFVEAAPRFWGMEFSAATALLPRGAQDSEIAAMVIAAEATADQPWVLPPAPGAEEIQAFKRDVEGLRGKPILMETPAANEEASAVAQLSAEVSKAAPIPRPGEALSTEAILKSGVDAAGVPVRAKSLPIERDSAPAQWRAAEQAELPTAAQDFSKSLPRPKRLRRARGSFTPGFRGGALRLVLLVGALLVTIVGAAWFKNWIPWKSAGAKPPASTHAVGGKSPLPAGSAETTNDHPDYSNTRVASDAPVTSAGMPAKSAGLPSGAVPAPVEGAEPSTQPGATISTATRPTIKNTSPTITTAGKPAANRPAEKTASSPVAPSGADSGVVPPKLISSVRAVASLEALRDFETGNVVIDAVVGTSGEVNFISVVSGPPSLRDSAVESLKQYKYEPATRNGQPVPAHVTITIHFRFEP
jgi:TonB family protein